MLRTFYTLTGMVALIIGLNLLCAPLKSHAAGRVFMWAGVPNVQVPFGLTNAVAIAAGYSHSLALRDDGTVVAWGSNELGERNVPPDLTNVVAVAGGQYRSFALKADGTVTFWGDSIVGAGIPTDLTNAVSIAWRSSHGMALRADGTVATWGYGGYGQSNVPPQLSNVVAIACGYYHNLALKADGKVVAWGGNWHNQTNVPPNLTNVVAIAGGHEHSLALKSDGTIVAWGGPGFFGETNVPTSVTNVVAIAAGYEYSLACRANGAVTAWGRTSYGQDQVPPTVTNAVALATDSRHVLALAGDAPSLMVFPGRTVTAGTKISIVHPFGSGVRLPRCQWRFNGTNLPAATNTTLVLPSVQPAQAGVYSLSATNAFGTVTTAEVTLEVLPLILTSQPKSQTTFRGATVTFSASVAGQSPLSYQWRFNGANLPAATNSSLVLTGVRFDQAGDYSVVVSNVFGTLTSPNAVLSVSLVAEWGDLTYGHPQPPGLTNVIAIASGASQMALRQDGTVVKWGHFGDTNGPPHVTNVVAIAAGSHWMALKADGEVIAWGENRQGQCNVPAGLSGVAAIAARGEVSYAFKSDGSVVAWGSVDPGSPLPEMRNVAAVSGYVYSLDGFFSEGLALRHDGTVVAWARNDYGETNLPPVPVPPGLSNVVAISGSSSPLALKADGTIVAWGYNGQGQTNVPPGLSNVVAISSGGFQLALKGDGTVVAWGYNGQGQTNVPPGLSNVVAVNAGYSRGMALVGDGSPVITIAPRTHSVLYGSTASLFVAAVGAGSLQYQWKFHGTNLPGATNATYALGAVQFNQSGPYSVVVSNALGSVTHDLVLNVVPALITTQSPDQITFRGATVSFRVTAEGPAPLSYQWRFAGADLTGQTNSTLVLTNIQFEQSGAYSVVVGSGVGSVTSTDSLLSVGRIAVWGESRNGQLRLPGALTNVLAVAGGAGHNLVLKADGTVVGWGDNYHGQSSPPSGLSNVVAIAAGAFHSLVLKSDGTVVTWGPDFYGLTNMPSGLSNVVAITATPYQSFALKADGKVTAWGSDTFGVGNPPSDFTNVVAVGAGYYQGVALKATGDIVVWGEGGTTPTNTGYVQAISVSEFNHGIALKADGTVAVWSPLPWNSFPDPPSSLSNVIAIASGNAHALALSATGSVVAWGDNSAGQTNVPTGLANVAAIAGGSVHSLALVGDTPPTLQALSANSSWGANGFSVTLPTQSGRVYRLEYKNTLIDADWKALPLVAGNGGMLTLTDPAAAISQRFYRVRQW